MPNFSGSKLKILYLYKLFLEKTDEEHSISMPEIISYLNNQGIHAERKSVYGDIEARQRSYRRQQAQRFIASLRDDKGDRLAMSVKGGKYVLIDYSNDKRGLNALHERLYAQMRGLERSDAKVKGWLR